jgi:hypothetical protein
MPTPLDTSPDGNSYNDLDELATRLDDSIRSAARWADADPDDQTRAAITSTQMLDAMIWEGTPTDDPPTQTLAFPRDGLTDKYGTLLADGTTPEEIKQAHALLSDEVLANPDLEAMVSTAAAALAKRVKAGSAEVELFAPGAFVPVTRLPARIQDLINAFLGSGPDDGSISGSESFGTGEESEFDDEDTMNLSEPLG